MTVCIIVDAGYIAVDDSSNAVNSAATGRSMYGRVLVCSGATVCSAAQQGYHTADASGNCLSTDYTGQYRRSSCRQDASLWTAVIMLSALSVCLRLRVWVYSTSVGLTVCDEAQAGCYASDALGNAVNTATVSNPVSSRKIYVIW